MNNGRDTVIVADDRERKSGVTDSLEKMEGVVVDIQRLPVGDYLVDGRLLFERKTLPDFAASIVDGRLFRQMTRLANSDCQGVLVLEGTGRDLASVGVSREAMQGALITVSLLLGVPVLRARDPGETARLIVYAASQVQSFTVKGFQRRGYKPKGKHPKQLHLLQSLPGIGREKANRLLKAFGSVEAVVTARPDELQAIDGIGKKTAAKIRWMVSERVSPYGAEPE